PVLVRNGEQVHDLPRLLSGVRVGRVGDVVEALFPDPGQGLGERVEDDEQSTATRVHHPRRGEGGELVRGLRQRVGGDLAGSVATSPGSGAVVAGTSAALVASVVLSSLPKSEPKVSSSATATACNTLSIVPAIGRATAAVAAVSAARNAAASAAPSSSAAFPAERAIPRSTCDRMIPELPFAARTAASAKAVSAAPALGGTTSANAFRAAVIVCSRLEPVSESATG